MIHLFEKGDYTWALFIGHLVLEKLLKALYIQNLSDTPPFIHDLLRLAENSHLSLTEYQKDILDTITTFNIRARYDDYKMEFHKKCSKEFTNKWIDNIEVMTKWIKEKLHI
ncbi:MAG: HEPN domain-containing protein [Desulfobacteraceae bacterium]|jgi:HEPN domain-containing protein